MKLILTGTTGFIGNEVLSQALSHSEVSSVVVISRKPLPETLCTNTKLKVIIIKDFNSYPPSMLEELSGADSCIWTIGAKSTSAELTRKVSIGYTLAAAQAFASIARSPGKPFRFVFTSGILAVRDPTTSVLIYPAARKVAGEAETKIMDFAKGTGNTFEAFVLRPAAVRPKDGGIMSMVLGVLPSVQVDVLAAVLLDSALNGAAQQTLENSEIRARGRDLLKQQNIA